MPYHVDRDVVIQATKTTISDLGIEPISEGSFTADLESARGNIPDLVNGDFFQLRGGVGVSNQGLWVVTDRSPTNILVRAFALDTKRGTPTQQDPSPGSQMWNAGNLYLHGNGNIPPNRTEIDFSDVLLLITPGSRLRGAEGDGSGNE